MEIDCTLNGKLDLNRYIDLENLKIKVSNITSNTLSIGEIKYYSISSG